MRVICMKGPTSKKAFMTHPGTKTPHRNATGRPSAKTCKRAGPPQHQRLYFTYAKQLHIINWRKQHSMESALDTFFCGAQGIARISAMKRILRWEASQMHITKMASNPSTATNKNVRPPGTATTLSREQEEKSHSGCKSYERKGFQ
ncbi:hypothetical protein B5M09_013937 [Aphanomyces astaci]|uniref:Uncharacterized protein n=1 Tax=Aphanomyces astaci TaxID=112090 RepID=A0A3R7Y1Y9_APHAT|nr:hypothetical protein B5M09_013937 [Aphanomyces astaci]